MSEWFIVLILKVNICYIIGSNPIMSDMNNKRIIDKKRRLLFLKYEFFFNIFKFVMASDDFSIDIKKSIYLDLFFLNKYSSIVRIRNICYLTGRTRGNYFLFKISRIKMKELISLGKFPGFLKSTW